MPKFILNMIPVNEPQIAPKALKYVSDCLKSGWVSSAGKYINLFESQFSHFIGTKYAITTTSGTTALHLALLSLGVGKGDEVILPDLTIAACAFAVLYTGATPVFVDVEKDTGTLDPKLIEKAISAKTKVIMAVHLYGHPADMDPILEIADKYGLKVIEDAAEAHGAEYKGKKVGGLGDIGIFSFYANKIVTTGEGGMVVTNNRNYAQKAGNLKDLAHSKTRFIHDEVGFNYRMTNLQAALGLAQLEQIEKYIKRKEQMAALYKKELDGIPGLILPFEKHWAKSVYWMYALLIDEKFGKSRDKVKSLLFSEGIDSRTYFYPLHRQPVFKGLDSFRSSEYPVSDSLSQQGIYLPSGLAITNAQIKRVARMLKKIKALK